MGPILLKNINFDETRKIVNKYLEGIKSKKLKVKVWFCDKDLSSVNSFSKTYDFIKRNKLV